MEIIGYVLGLLMHVATKWAAWKTQQKGRAWMSYWPEYGAVNITSFLAALAGSFLWTSGALPEILRIAGQGVVNAAASVGGGSEFTVPTPGGFVAAMGAGYAMDSLARTLWMVVQGRRAPKEDQP